MHSTPENPANNLTLVLDQGSHASRIAVFSETGDLLQLDSESVTTHSPEADIYEQDANEILNSLQSLLERLKPDLIHNIKCCGLSTQRSTIVAWNKSTGKPLSPAISWRDLRNQHLITHLQQTSSRVHHISGLPLSAHYSASKIHWLLNNNPAVELAARKQQLCIAPLASFLLFHLLQQATYVIDHSNAQRTQLFDIQTLDWSDELLQVFDINKILLPECKPVIHKYGVLKHNNIPLTTVCGDQNAILYAYPALGEQNTLINIGTGAFILSKSPERLSSTHKSEKLLRTLSSSNTRNAEFITEGTVNGAGAALSWAQQAIPCEDLFTRLPLWLKQNKSPPVFINTISGLGSPWWCQAGDAEFIGHNLDDPENKYTAIIESIVFLIFNNIQQLQHTPDSLFVSGGLSRLDDLCQKLADLSQSGVFRFKDSEATARGCAWLSNQLTKNRSPNWNTLQISSQFEATKNSPELISLGNRYQQFVGELEKRCSRD